MLQLSKLLLIFAPSFVNNRRRHRGELTSFDPLENLENSLCTGNKRESCFSCSSIYSAHSLAESAHIYTCRCELIFHSYVHRYSRTFQLKNVEKAHTSLCRE